MVCDLREPPAWIYAAYRFFVGPAAFRPRDFRRVDRAVLHLTCEFCDGRDDLLRALHLAGLGVGGND